MLAPTGNGFISLAELHNQDDLAKPRVISLRLKLRLIFKLGSLA